AGRCQRAESGPGSVRRGPSGLPEEIMFTGIVRELGTVERVQRAKGLVRLTVHAPGTAERVSRLESVAVNGACLSVVDRRGPALVFEMIPETARLTTLGRLRPGHRVHLEP